MPYSEFLINKLSFRPYSSLSIINLSNDNFKEDIYKNLYIDYAKINKNYSFLTNK